MGHRFIGTCSTWGVLGALGLGLALGSACSGAKRGAEQHDPDGLGTKSAHGASNAADSAAGGVETLPLGAITKSSFREHPAQYVWVFDGDPSAPRKMEIGQAEARGFTVVDLGNAWVPYIFSEKTPGVEDHSPNRYRELYVGLANDRVDSDGRRLGEHTHNYLELYGIPPSLKVIESEWARVDAEVEPCLEEAGFDPSVFARHEGIIAFKSSRTQQHKYKKSAALYGGKLFKAMKKAKLSPDDPAQLEQAATHPKTKALYAKWREFQNEVDVIDHAQRRFRCERLFNGKDGQGAFTQGVYDGETTHALANFEKKHDLMGWGHFKGDNKAVLAMTADEAVHARLLRVLQERVVTSAGIVEDGSAARWQKKFTWKDKSGKEQPLRDLATEFSAAAVERLGLQTPESAKKQLAVLSDLGDGDFENLLVAIDMPPLPEYYAENMEFSTVIDRGDVWYDFPYTENAERVSQPRRRYPHLTLYTHYLDQKIPLVHWRTTIGSWRNEVVEGEVMLKYKNSDVGARVWKDIVAAPVWIPPTTTPPAELIKPQWKNGKLRRDVSYDEIGPGFRSAYGLVAAYHIRQITDEEGNITSELDNSIRTHGSVDYMSILRRFSHGCHRLYNMDAVRMFSFILEHRDHTRQGQQPVGVGRVLEHEGETYHMKITTRGYRYELVKPIDVVVTKGRIKGRRRSPITDYVPKPVPPMENEMEFDDGFGGTFTLPIPLPPSL